MRRKLRLLTVVSLAEQNKMLAYNLLMSELDINTVRELEDLVIEGISGENNNGVKSKLIKIAFFFSWCHPRKIRPEKFPL